MSNLTALISGGGAAGAAAEGGSTMVTSTGIAASDLSVGDHVKLTASGQFVSANPDRGYYLVNKGMDLQNGSTINGRPPNVSGTSYNSPGGPITLSDGTVLWHASGYHRNYDITLSFFTLRDLNATNGAMTVTDTNNIQGWKPESYLFAEVGDDADYIYVSFISQYRSQQWPYWGGGKEMFITVAKATGTIHSLHTNNGSSMGSSHHQYTQSTNWAPNYDGRASYEMAGQVISYGAVTSGDNSTYKNVGWRFTTIDPTSTVYSAQTQVNPPESLHAHSDNWGCVAVDQADQVFICWYTKNSVINYQVVSFDAAGAQTIVTAWTPLFASGTSTTLTSSTAHSAAIMKVSDGTVALVNATTATQLEVQKFTWNGTALVESGTPYTIDATVSASITYNVNFNTNSFGQAIRNSSTTQYQCEEYRYHAGGNVMGEIDLVSNTVNFYYIGKLAGMAGYWPSYDTSNSRKYITGLGHYNGSDFRLVAKSVAVAKNAAVTQEVVGVVTGSALKGATATVELEAGITAQGTLPSSGYTVKDGMYYPLSTGATTDKPVGTSFSVPQSVIKTVDMTNMSITNSAYYSGYAQWNAHNANLTANADRLLTAITGKGKIDFALACSSAPSNNDINMGFKVVVDGKTVMDTTNVKQYYSTVSDRSNWKVYDGYFNESIEITVKADRTMYHSFIYDLELYQESNNVRNRKFK